MRTVVLADDLNGTTPAETHTFSVDGDVWELELGEKNLAALKEGLQPFIAVARKGGKKAVQGRPARQYPETTQERRQWLAKVREWGRQNGAPNLSDYGRVPHSILRAYEEAHR